MKIKSTIFKTFVLIFLALFAIGAKATTSNLISISNVTVEQSQQGFRYKVYRIDTDYLLHNLSTNFQRWEQSCRFTRAEKDVIWEEYQKLRRGISENAVYVRDDGMAMDTRGIIRDYLLYEDNKGNMITEEEYSWLSSKEKKKYKKFPPMYYLVKYLNTICQACVDNGKYL